MAQGDGTGMDERMARHLIIAGRVQGVGYRYALLQEAAALGLSGWVRNLTGGEVEAVIIGRAEAVDALTDWAHRGPALARVTQVRETPVEPAEDDDTPFEVRPTARRADR